VPAATPVAMTVKSKHGRTVCTRTTARQSTLTVVSKAVVSKAVAWHLSVTIVQLKSAWPWFSLTKQVFCK